MPTTQMNTRIDTSVKKQGDAALAQAGYSPSQVIRTIWTFAASHAHEPHVVRSFLQGAETERDSKRKAQVEAKLDALEQALKLHEKLDEAVGPCQNTRIEGFSDRELRADALFSRWESRGLL